MVKSGTEEEGTLDSLVFTILDLDQGTHGETESVTLGGFTDVALQADTQIRRFDHPDGKATFMASKKGTYSDNPTDALEMTHVQKNKISLLEVQKHNILVRTYVSD